MDDLISVIVPALNAEAYIERCLDSLVRQTYQNLEIICSDDGSTDGTVEKIKQYNDPRIKLIVRGQNYGISLTRNFGIGIASGKYIGFIDSDDFVDPDFYQKLHRSMIENDAEIVSTATRVIWPDKTRIWSSKPQVCQKFEDKLIAVRNGSCWNKLYKRDLIRRNNIEFPAGVVFEDNLFIVKCLFFCNKLVIIDDTAYNYMMVSSSLTHDPAKQEARKKNSLTVTKMMVDFISTHTPRSKKEVLRFILRNIVVSDYLADNEYYHRFKAMTGPSFRLYKARFKALKKSWFKK